VISEINFIQYTGYFFERIVDKKYVDVLEEKRKERKLKKILDKEKEEVQGDRETGRLINFLA
jgi:hypothetical protein